MQSISLLELRAATRERCDMENSQFVSDAELSRYINQSLAELYDLLVASYEDYFLLELDFTLPTNLGMSLAIPNDVYKLRGVDRQISGGSGWERLRRINFADRNRSNSYGFGCGLGYRLSGAALSILPAENAAGNYRALYIPSFVALVNDADTTSLSFSGWDEYVVVDASIKCLQKEESDVSILMAQKERLTQRIKAMAADRDSGEPERVSDVRGSSRYDRY